jgi:hypothetical protein
MSDNELIDLCDEILEFITEVRLNCTEESNRCSKENMVRIMEKLESMKHEAILRSTKR